MYPGKQPDYPGLLKQGWKEFRTPDGEDALYHALPSEVGVYMEVVRRRDDRWKAKDYVREVTENRSREQLAVLLFRDDTVPWGDYQGTLELGDPPEGRDKDYGHGKGREQAAEPDPMKQDPDTPDQ